MRNNFVGAAVPAAILAANAIRGRDDRSHKWVANLNYPVGSCLSVQRQRF